MASLGPHHGRAAALARYRDPDDPTLQAAQRALTAAALRRAIERALRADPPMTRLQRAELARLLGGAR